MKSVWNSFKAAFAMFSKIPTPMVDWNKENMKYMMCFFPFVGTAIGILIWLVGCVLGSHVRWNLYHEYWIYDVQMPFRNWRDHISKSKD